MWVLNPPGGYAGKTRFLESLPDAPKMPILGTPGALSPKVNTGVIPLLNHGQNDPHPRTLVPKVSLKSSFPRIPTYPAGYPHGPSTTPMKSHP